MAWMMPLAMLGSSAISAFANRGQDQMKKYPNMSPQQQRMFSGAIQNPIENSPLYGSGSNYLQQLLSNDPQAFQAFEAPYMQNFQQNIVPGIAERFAGAGTGSGAVARPITGRDSR